MTKTYAIADVHGRSDLIKTAFKVIAEYFQPGDKIITLGDYIDRGPDSKGVIQFLRHYQKEHPDQLICLTGNHENMMLQVITNPNQYLANWWLGNGGGTTLVSYGHPTHGKLDLTVLDVDDVIWLVELPTLHEDTHRIFVHAGVDRFLPLDQQPEHDLIWKIYKQQNDDFEGGYQADLTSEIKHVVHGHHQHECVQYHTYRTDLDTFAWHTGRLAIGVFDDTKPHGPVGVLWAEGPSYQALMATSSELTPT